MPEEQVGVIVKFFAKPSVAAIEMTSDLQNVGGEIYKVHRVFTRMI